jgi:two-component system response regulator (stage 0 sporulation protein F)
MTHATRILVVEDDAHQRLLYREELEEQGYEVIEAADGRAALAALDEHAPDAVVLDINMPGMNGLDTLARIHDRNHGIPVVINSAYTAYRRRYVSWLADAYVVKSSRLDELRETLRSVLAAAAAASTPAPGPVPAPR